MIDAIENILCIKRHGEIQQTDDKKEFCVDSDDYRLRAYGHRRDSNNSHSDDSREGSSSATDDTDDEGKLDWRRAQKSGDNEFIKSLQDRILQYTNASSDITSNIRNPETWLRLAETMETTTGILFVSSYHEP
jgi:hypothetical protein